MSRTISNNTQIYSYDETLQASIKYFNGDELAAKVFVDKYALRDDKNNLLELTPNDMHWRHAKELAIIEEKKFKNPYSKEQIFEKLNGFKTFCLQGSPMFAIGNPYQYVSLSNCVVTDSPRDSLEGIYFTDNEIAQLTKRRCGVGWDNSLLRPKGMSTKNAAKTTSGMVSFMDQWSETIRTVGMHGRRGASLQSANCFHPEILDFISVKKDLSKVTGSNISVQWMDEFLNAVLKDEKIKLRWPVSKEHADLLSKNFPEIEEEVSAKDVWREFVHAAWSMGEPGCQFIDTVHKDSPGFPYGHIEVASNPCGEQFLPAYAVCRLLALNLLGYVDKPFTKDASWNSKKFEEDVRFMQRMGDNLVDIEIELIDRIIDKINRDPEPEYVKGTARDLWQKIKEITILDRRTGCGFTGLADALAALGIKYGSDEAVEFTEKIQKSMAASAYSESVEMAKELGAFSQFDPKLDEQSGFVQKIKAEFPELFAEMQKYGRRNMVLLTIAPTGSLSCLTQTSSGMEPVFMLEYMRRKKGNPGDKGFKTDFIDNNGDHWMHFNVQHKGLQSYQEISGNKDYGPYQDSTASELSWQSRIKMQAALQKWVDNSISSTVNLPKDVSEETVHNLYIEAWKAGLKGITVYRDGCRDGVLVNKKEQEKSLTNQALEKRPRKLPCDIHHIKITKKLDKVRTFDYVITVGKLNDRPYEVFAFDNDQVPKKVKEGQMIKIKRGEYKLIFDSGEVQDVTVDTTEGEDSVTRLTSMLLRHNVEIQYIVQQLEKAKGDLYSYSRAIARALKKYIPEGTKATGLNCPSCASSNIKFENGCWACSDCGHSKCG